MKRLNKLHSNDNVKLIKSPNDLVEINTENL